MWSVRALLVLLISVTVSGLFAREDDENIVYREAVDSARKSGFGDLEIDNLHGDIGRRLKSVLTAGGLPDGPGGFEELVRNAKTRSVITGKDKDGKQYLRIRLRDNLSVQSAEVPTQYFFRGHCYLYPAADGGLEKIIFQFYRMNYTGKEYVRDLRRYIHPDPKDVAQAKDKPIGAPVTLLSNNSLTVEYYEANSTVPPKWEDIDGIPNPTIDWKPTSSLVLHKPEDPIPYPKQVQIVMNYKKLLRVVDRKLALLEKRKRLERNQALEKVLDYSGANF